MRKKAMIEAETLKLILGVVVFAFIVFVIVPKIYEFAAKSPDKETRMAFERIGEEVKSLKAGETIRPLITMNIDYNVKVFNKDYAYLPNQCKKQSCLCLYHKSRDQPNGCIPVKFSDNREVRFQAANAETVITSSDSTLAFPVEMTRTGDSVKVSVAKPDGS